MRGSSRLPPPPLQCVAGSRQRQAGRGEAGRVVEEMAAERDGQGRQAEGEEKAGEREERQES